RDHPRLHGVCYGSLRAASQNEQTTQKPMMTASFAAPSSDGDQQRSSPGSALIAAGASADPTVAVSTVSKPGQRPVNPECQGNRALQLIRSPPLYQTHRRRTAPCQRMLVIPTLEIWHP